MLTRREFVTQLSLLPALRTSRPELVLFNGNLLTIDEALPRAQAIAIWRDRIVAVGSNADIRPLADATTKLVDLGGSTVVPGFIDAHNHPAVAGRLHLRQVDADLRSIQAIQAAIRERAAKTPKGEWVLAFKYDDTKTSEGRFLTRQDLDAATTEHPIYVEHRGGHSAYVNSLALERAGIKEDTPDPAGGR